MLGWKAKCAIFQTVQCIAIFLVTFRTDAHTLEITVYSSRLQVADYIGNKTSFPSVLGEGTPVSLALFYLPVPVITWIHHVIMWYQGENNKGYRVGRWIEYGITAPMMTVALALLCGITDSSALFTIFLLNAMTMAAGARIEYLISRSCARQLKIWQRLEYGQLAVEMFYTVSILYLITWGLTVVRSFWLHAEDAPTFVLLLVIFLSLLYGTFPFILYQYMTKRWKWKYVDKVLDVASLVSKLGLDWIIVGGFVGWTK
jgi:hypothetical protein